MAVIFISYRRGDQPGFAGRLADALATTFGADNVFRDIEDIHPGEDFAATIRSQLQTVGVMLVLIGPAWLTASNNGVRRLDEPEDFVRLEIEAGLQSGKPVLPVLIGGVSMPAEKELPPSIGALARRQALVLSDASWASDLARLVQSIKPLLPLRRRLPLRSGLTWGVAAIGLIALLVFGFKTRWPDSAATKPGQATAQIAQNLPGRWTAEVKYDWGAVHKETFELRLEQGEVRGSATYLRLARSVEQGRLLNDRIEFITHSQEALGDAPVREVTHRYRGVVKPGELHLTLESSGGHSTHPPVQFVARRVLE